MPRKRTHARKTRATTTAAIPARRQNPEWEWDDYHDDGETPHLVFKLSDIVVELEDHLPRVFDEITKDLAAHGIAVRASLPDIIGPNDIDLSAIDPKTAEIAWLLFRLGLIVNRHAWMTNERDRLLPVHEKSQSGTQAITARSTTTHSVIRKAFADLLDAEEGVEYSDTRIAEQLAITLSPKGKGFSASAIRRQIGTMRKEIVAVSKVRSLSRLSASQRIEAILQQKRGLPGVSWNTVRYLLYRPK